MSKRSSGKEEWLSMYPMKINGRSASVALLLVVVADERVSASP